MSVRKMLNACAHFPTLCSHYDFGIVNSSGDAQSLKHLKVSVFSGYRLTETGLVLKLMSYELEMSFYSKKLLGG